MENIQILAGIIQDILISTALIIGGAWTIYRFIIYKEFETNLEIETEVNSFPFETGDSIVFINVTLKNIGKRQIDARPRRHLDDKQKYVYKDERETFYHSCALQVRQINTSLKTNAFYSWHNQNDLLEVNNIPNEINLLGDYEDANKNLDFGLVPGETAKRSALLMLQPAHYLARVTFWGDRGTSRFHTKLAYWGSNEKYDYWNHLFYFQILAQDKKP